MSTETVWIVQEMFWTDGMPDDIRSVFASRQAAEAWMAAHEPTTDRNGRPMSRFELAVWAVERDTLTRGEDSDHE